MPNHTHLIETNITLNPRTHIKFALLFNQKDASDKKQMARSMSRSPSKHKPHTLRHRIYEIMEAGSESDHASKYFDIFIVTLIVLNIAAFCAETVPELERAYGPWFNAFEIASVAIFTVEYILRLWSSIEIPYLSRMPAWKARLKFASRGPQIIDLLAVLPFYLSHLFSIDLRVLRILRLLRFLKLSRYSPAMHTLIRVMHNEGRALSGAALLLLAAVLFASSGIYYLESVAQPDKFGSIPQASWWAIATLSTVGYGDVAPQTALGRLFGGLIMVLGLCVLALPVAIISTGFAQEVSRRDFVVNWSLMSRIPILADLEPHEAADILPLLHAHTLPPGMRIINEGNPGDAMYFIASGRVRLQSNSTQFDYETGDFFGVVAMLEQDIHHASFTTLTRSRLLKLHREDFDHLAVAKPELVAHIKEIAETRIAERGLQEGNGLKQTDSANDRS